MESLYWKNKKGLQLYAEHYPVRNPQAVIAFVHGQGEHIGRYAHVADFFNRADIAWLAFDQQGYGKSEGKKGHIDHLDDFFDDITLLLEKARDMYPDKPLFLYGHSMGGGLVLNYAARTMPNLTGLIATSPWIRLAFEAPAIKVVAGKILRRFMPDLTLPTGLAAHFISRVPEVVKAYKNDPHVHDKISASAGIALMEAAEWINKWSGVFPFPVLLVHGTGDKITSPAATRELAGRVAGDVTHKEWPDLYHETHNEENREEVLTFTLKWIKGFL